MTNNDDMMLREVDQALAEDETSQKIKKNLPAIIGAALIVVGGVGGWQLWESRRAATSARMSAAYDAALKEAGAESGTKALEALAEESGAYAALARMRLAGEYSIKGDREKALGLYRSVYGGGAGSKRLKDVARLRAGYLSLADGRDAVLKDLGDLETDATALGFYARELIALAALKAGDYQSAEEMFRKAASSPAAPEPVRLRAGEFAALAGAGKAGVEFPALDESAKSDVERYLEGLEQASSDLTSIVEGGADDAAEPSPPAGGDAEESASGEAASTQPSNPEGNQ